jgi:diguanylate cyclase (GGDEF)-like protein
MDERRSAFEMYHDPALTDEPARLAALQRLAVLDSEPEEPFENVVALVRAVLNVPMAAVSLIDEDRQWFMARVGVDVPETPRDISFCTYTIQQRDALIIPDATKDARFAANPFVLSDPGVRSYVGIPLKTPDGYNIGSLCAIDTKVREFTSSEVDMLSKFANIVVADLELRRIAGKDQLTGALTRRGFIERVEQEISRHHRYGRPASLAMIDIDHFKLINDTYGHSAGDAVLREVARLLRLEARPNDLLGRLGGEEFAMLMPESDAKAGHLAAERLRRSIEGAHIEAAPGLQVRVTASFGVVELSPAHSHSESWLAAADVLLYAAKRRGRNRCVAMCDDILALA